MLPKSKSVLFIWGKEQIHPAKINGRKIESHQCTIKNPWKNNHVNTKQNKQVMSSSKTNDI